MWNKLKKIFDPTFFRFIVVGCINTLVGYAVMFGLYNLAGLYAYGDRGYWISSAGNYVVGSIVSYFLNKHFTFRNREKGAKVLPRFVLNILLCYLIAYRAARPLMRRLLAETALSEQWRGNITMFVGSVIFTALNYFGQRFFAFKTEAGA